VPTPADKFWKMRESVVAFLLIPVQGISGLTGQDADQAATNFRPSHRFDERFFFE
jgi:hypothetical protein